MVVRVELNKLEKQGSLYFLNGVLFSGEAYDHRDNQLYAVFVIVEGIITQEKPFGFLQSESLLRLDYDEIEFGETEDFPSHYQGKLFNGVIYEYNFGYCSGEFLYIDGMEVEKAYWTPDGSGNIEEYWKDTETSSHRILWNNGLLSQFNFMLFRLGDIILDFNDDICLERIILGEQIPDMSYFIPRADLGLNFYSLNDLFIQRRVSEILVLDYVNNTDLIDWLSHGYLNPVIKLVLNQSQVSTEGLRRLALLPKLASLTVNEQYIYKKQTDPQFAQYQNNREQELKLALKQIQTQYGIETHFSDKG